MDWEDVEKIADHSWHLTKDGYAEASWREDDRTRSILMHRLVLIDPGELVDHEDRDTLNNRKDNLRSSNKSINAFNRQKFAGVSWDPIGEQWIARLGRRPQIGRFPTRRQAQQAVVDELYKIDPITAKHREELMNAENY